MEHLIAILTVDAPAEVCCSFPTLPLPRRAPLWKCNLIKFAVCICYTRVCVCVGVCMVQCALACTDFMAAPLCSQTIFCLNFTLVTCLINSFTSGGVREGGSGKEARWRKWKGKRWKGMGVDSGQYAFVWNKNKTMRWMQQKQAERESKEGCRRVGGWTTNWLCLLFLLLLLFFMLLLLLRKRSKQSAIDYANGWTCNASGRCGLQSSSQRQQSLITFSPASPHTSPL